MGATPFPWGRDRMGATPFLWGRDRMGATPFPWGRDRMAQLHFICGDVGCQTIIVSKKRALNSYHYFTLLLYLH